MLLKRFVHACFVKNWIVFIQICDFGLARWLPAKLTHLQVTVFEGTFGYVPPEYTTHGVFSEKTDVYALGVVLLELLTGRRAIDAAKLSLLDQRGHRRTDDDASIDRSLML